MRRVLAQSRARISTLFLLIELRHMNSSIPVIPAMFHAVSKSWELAALAINYRALQPTEMRCDLDHIASAIVRAHKNNLVLSRPKNLPFGKEPDRASTLSRFACFEIEDLGNVPHAVLFECRDRFRCADYFATHKGAPAPQTVKPAFSTASIFCRLVVRSLHLIEAVMSQNGDRIVIVAFVTQQIRAKD